MPGRGQVSRNQAPEALDEEEDEVGDLPPRQPEPQVRLGSRPTHRAPLIKSSMPPPRRVSPASGRVSRDGPAEYWL